MKTIDVRTRIQLKNILFMTDFSSAADAAAPYAAELAKRYGAKLHALHVRPPVINPMTPPETWKGLEEAAEIVAERRRHELLNTFAGVQTEILINEGDLWSNVAAAIEGCNIDLIVMGTRAAPASASFCWVRSQKRSFDKRPARC
jgi:nucleotide-binding universal stress UspA family protein